MKMVIAAVLCGLLMGAEEFVPKVAKDVYLDPKEAGIEHKMQGEYAGELLGKEGGMKKIAAQIVAMGNGKFRAVMMEGGLPGDGWDGKSRLELQGKLDGAEVTLGSEGDVYHGKISAGIFAGEIKSGERFSLMRVERKSPTLAAKPPEGAIVLFDGEKSDELVDVKVGGHKMLFAGAKTKRPFTDFKLHAEFLVPFMPTGKMESRGNSGIYIQDRYEIQILDSFGQKPAANECGGVYRQIAPTLNMSFPPLVWQTFDIDFTSAKWDGDKKTRNAVVSVRHNGVLVHDRVEIKNKTGQGKPEGPQPLPIYFQFHGDPIYFRNLWIVESK
jgi:hypothetical protein